MSNKLKQIDLKNLCILLCQWHDQYIKSLDPSKMKKDENSYKKNSYLPHQIYDCQRS